MQAGAAKTRSRRQSVSSKKTSRVEAKQTKPVSVKRSVKDKGLKERAVRFRSTDEEYIFESEPSEKIVIPDGSDVFQKILKDMKGHLVNENTSAGDDEVFDGVFTATVDRLEWKADVKKSTVPRKSILKRRNSYRR